ARVRIPNERRLPATQKFDARRSTHRPPRAARWSMSATAPREATARAPAREPPNSRHNPASTGMPAPHVAPLGVSQGRVERRTDLATFGAIFDPSERDGGGGR